MDTLIICMIPLGYTFALLAIGWYVGRHGSPVKWVGFRRRNGGATPSSTGPVRVTKEYE